MSRGMQSYIRPFFRAGRRFVGGALLDVISRGWHVRPLPDICWCGEHFTSAKGSGRYLERRLVFVYRAGYRARGSVRLRVAQLAAAVKASVSNPELVIVVTEDSHWLRSTEPMDMVWTKSTLTGDVRSALSTHAARGHRVFVDFVDGTDIPEIADTVYGYICASRTELNYRAHRGNRAWYVPHAVDTRIPHCDFDRESLQFGYFGRPWMVEHLENLSEIRSIPAEESFGDRDFVHTMETVAQWSHHYSVRSFFGVGNFKPPTKVFVAARLGALFVGSRQDEEVQLLMGNDYPYLSKNSSLEEVRKTLEFARDTFLAEPWNRARKTMQVVRRESCDAFIAEQLIGSLEVRR